MENRMFEKMLEAAHGWLKDREPEDIARKAGAEFEAAASELRLDSLGRKVSIGWPGLEISGELEGWHQLVILHYLHRADGVSVSENWIPFAQMKDGMVRGGGFDRQCAAELGQLLKGRTEAEIRAMCETLGGKMVESNADLCVELSLLPRCPVLLKIWLADDEMELSARLLVNASADHYLTIEDAVTVGGIVLSELAKAK